MVIHDVMVICKNKWNFVILNANLNIHNLRHIQLIGTVIIAYYILFVLNHDKGDLYHLSRQFVQ